MVSDLEQYKKGLQDDAAELMELCEKLELQNRKMSKDQQVRLFSTSSPEFDQEYTSILFLLTCGREAT